MYPQGTKLLKHLLLYYLSSLLTTQPKCRGIPLEIREGGRVNFSVCYQSEKEIEKEAELLWQENIFSWSHLLT